MNEEGTKYQRARERVEQIKYLYIHLGVYVLGNLFLFLLNMIVSPANLWFYWPLLGWSFGIVVHAFDVFASGRLFGAAWEERKIAEIMEEEKRDFGRN